MEQTPRTPFSQYLRLLAFPLCIMLLLRLAFWVVASPGMPDPLGEDAWKAFYIGLRFDARIAALLTLPLAVALCVPNVAASLHRVAKAVAVVYGALFFVVLVLYALDFGFYLYLGNRLSMVAVELAADAKEAVGMLWQSYPVLWIALAVAAGAALCGRCLYRLLCVPLRASGSFKRRATGFFAGFLVFFLAVYGQLNPSLFPLRWSYAFFTTNESITALGLNPLQNLYDTYGANSGEFSLEEARAAYPRMAQFLLVDKPDEASLDYERAFPAKSFAPEKRARPNVVIVIMESLSYAKTSFAPGGADPTPRLKALAAESMLYHRFFANARTTARAVFSTMTGVPDVNKGGTGSRNPLAVDQRIVGNEFAGYDRYYMIGGNTSWANIRAVLAQNIQDLRLLEESDWKAPSADVWGVSDYDLFMEAHERLAAHDADTPFLAVIQTASYHKPYTIPETPGFSCGDPPVESVLDDYGFVDGEREYCSMRYTDYALGSFMAKAKSAAYYDNTVFFIFGDHGIKDFGKNMPDGYSRANLGPWHVPLLVHASPSLGLVEPGESFEAASQVDVFPTAAGRAGIAYRTWTLGRDLFDSRYDGTRAAYIGGKPEDPVRLVAGEYCFYDNRNGGQFLYRMEDSPAEDMAARAPEVFTRLKTLASDIDATVHYMLFNNKKR